ncbi:hypothetical protein SLA2020_185830 [Shorea laevis]
MLASSSNTASSVNTASVWRGKGLWRAVVVVFATLLAPIVAAVLVYHLDSFDPSPIPLQDLSSAVPVAALMVNDHMLEGAEFLGKGQLEGPEDIAYDAKSQVIYTGCRDGWIKRVTVNESSAASQVQNFVNTGGKPLGLVFGHNNELIVADASKGLLNVSEGGAVELLTDGAEDLKFKLTDAVDVAEDGIIYFTDASYKYDAHHAVWDFLEGRPYGRLCSYNPVTKETKVLVRDLYFANGVAVSPDQNYVILCETPRRRCRKINIQGEKKGEIERFVNDLPGYPDNIHYDGEGHYWIGFSWGIVKGWEMAYRYPFIRKITALLVKYAGRPSIEKNGGVFVVDLEGKPVAHYYEPELSMITSGIKIQNYLYCGSIKYQFIIRLNLDQYPARHSSYK